MFCRVHACTYCQQRMFYTDLSPMKKKNYTKGLRLMCYVIYRRISVTLGSVIAGCNCKTISKVILKIVEFCALTFATEFHGALLPSIMFFKFQINFVAPSHLLELYFSFSKYYLGEKIFRLVTKTYSSA